MIPSAANSSLSSDAIVRVQITLLIHSLLKICQTANAKFQSSRVLLMDESCSNIILVEININECLWKAMPLTACWEGEEGVP